MSKSDQGAKISEKVAKSLDEITSKARQVDDLIAEIAVASQEQSQGIDQVTRAVSDMDTVTQANAATAQQTSAAAAELNSQTAGLKSVIEELTRMVDSAKAKPGEAVAPREEAPVKKAEKKKTPIKVNPERAPAVRNGNAHNSSNGHSNGSNQASHSEGNGHPSPAVRISRTITAADATQKGDEGKFFKDL
jgi:methyl-accepting chemotaxis protein